MKGMKRILIVGSRGQLGTEFQRSFSSAGELICFDKDQVDLAVEEQVRQMVREVEPDLILNAAAYTAVDRAESERDLAMAINSMAPRVLAEEAARRDVLLVHYSTDYVFDGTKAEPWLESDQPNPLNVYGESKRAGERAVEEVGGKYLIFRTSWVYGPHGNNFLLTMLRLGQERDRLNIVDDQIGGPTSSIALADATRTVVDGVLGGAFGNEESWVGTYHMTCGGSTSWCGFARAIFAQTAALRRGRTVEVLPIPSSDYPTPAKRPMNSVLSNRKLQETFDIRMPIWTTSLTPVVEQIQLNSR